uniref:Integrase catalytic domain-containing protein n=1 Tax=Ananas comosus var. bracteatus TaxID=296719 RepID=A0A6V7PFU8_ANACO|nr:unnamed protein product [Ananas comosus var. bracteatus]
MQWERLIPRVGMLTTTGPLGTAQAELPIGRSYRIGTLTFGGSGHSPSRLPLGPGRDSLPQSQAGHDAIWVVVDRLTKSAHFLPIYTTWSGDKLAQVYLDEVVRLHGVPVSIVSDRDPWFTFHFWKSLQDALGMRLDFSTAFHPQSDGQSERTIQILEDMLRACVLDYSGGWHEYLPMAEFAYNNSYQESIVMALFEALSRSGTQRKPARRVSRPAVGLKHTRRLK